MTDNDSFNLFDEPFALSDEIAGKTADDDVNKSLDDEDVAGKKAKDNDDEGSDDDGFDAGEKKKFAASDKRRKTPVIDDDDSDDDADAEGHSRNRESIRRHSLKTLKVVAGTMNEDEQVSQVTMIDSTGEGPGASPVAGLVMAVVDKEIPDNLPNFWDLPMVFKDTVGIDFGDGIKRAYCKCLHCGYTIRGVNSSKLKAHLANVKGRDVKVCDQHVNFSLEQQHLYKKYFESSGRKKQQTNEINQALTNAIIHQRNDIINDLVQEGTSRSAKLLHQGNKQLLLTDKIDTNKNDFKKAVSQVEKILLNHNSMHQFSLNLIIK